MRQRKFTPGTCIVKTQKKIGGWGKEEGGGKSEKLANLQRKAYVGNRRRKNLLALVRRLSRVLADVVHEMILSCEGLWTVLAPEWSFTCVLTHMVDQVFFPSERFGAISTAMW